MYIYIITDAACRGSRQASPQTGSSPVQSSNWSARLPSNGVQPRCMGECGREELARPRLCGGGTSDVAALQCAKLCAADASGGFVTVHGGEGLVCGCCARDWMCGFCHVTSSGKIHCPDSIPFTQYTDTGDGYKIHRGAVYTVVWRLYIGQPSTPTPIPCPV